MSKPVTTKWTGSVRSRNGDAVIREPFCDAVICEPMKLFFYYASTNETIYIEGQLVFISISFQRMLAQERVTIMYSGH